MMSLWQKGVRGFGRFDAEILRSRTVARTERGFLALVSIIALPGDGLAVCEGGNIPLVFRVDATSKLRLLGDSYVHGMMQGQEFRVDQCQDIRVT